MCYDNPTCKICYWNVVSKKCDTCKAKTSSGEDIFRITGNSYLAPFCLFNYCSDYSDASNFVKSYIDPSTLSHASGGCSATATRGMT